MLTETFTFNGATFTVRRADVRTRIKKTIVYGRLGATQGMAEDEWAFIYAYTGFITQTTVDGDPGFKVPTVSASEGEHQAALEAFLSADEELYDLLNDALNKVDRAPNDADLTPDTPEKKEKNPA